MIIIDTDVLIEISDKRSERGNQMYQKIIANGDDVGITSITLYETIYGLIFMKQFMDWSLWNNLWTDKI